MSIIKTSFYTLLFVIGGITYSLNNTSRELYILYKNDNELITKITSQESKRTSFKILRHKYNTENKRKEYLDVYAENPYEPIDPFVYHFIALEDPKRLDSIKDLSFTSIDSVSHDKVEFGHKTKVYFVELTDNNSYLYYETFLEFYE